MDKTLEKIVEEYRRSGGNIITLLQDTQECFGYLPKDAIRYFAEKLSIAPSRFFGVATFYAQFRMKPSGRHRITACCGTACHVRGADRILSGLKRELKLAEDEDTTSDGEFTLEQVNCVGACSIAPVVIVDRKVYGKTSSDKILKELHSMKGPAIDEE